MFQILATYLYSTSPCGEHASALYALPDEIIYYFHIIHYFEILLKNFN